MNRRNFARLAGGAGVAGLTGCETLDALDTSASAEGTGIQIVGAVTILAKYRANQAQRAAADQAARRAFVAIAMKPAMQKQVSAQKRKTAGRPRKAVAQQQNVPATAPATGAAPDRADEAAIADAWKKTAKTYQMAGEAAASEVAMPANAGGIAFAPMSSQSILTASSAQAPNYFAVAVPPQGIEGERGASAVVMLWDARQRALSGDLAYAVKEPLKEGQQVKIDGRKAVYVGKPKTAAL